jgi:hypothetical protein
MQSVPGLDPGRENQAGREESEHSGFCLSYRFCETGIAENLCEPPQSIDLADPWSIVH